MQKALFAAGCFWGVQFYFDQVPGVIKTTVGYAGGRTTDPTYEQVCSQRTGHAEVVLIEFDSQQVDYETLVKHFFRMHDPTQLNRQGLDDGESYRSAIFYYSALQKEVAERIKRDVQSEHEDNIVTEITPAAQFYAAEQYHQKYTERTGQGACHVAYAAV